jgi:glycosyltransferase involved in cell wall biosynthesis
VAEIIKIGVVIPIYNGEPFLAETLRSLQSQTFKEWHCVLIDDGSIDHAFQVAEEFAQNDERFRIVRQKNCGVSAARNRGFQELPPEVTHVTFMDQDDVYLPQAFETLVQACRANAASIGAHGIAEMIDENSRGISGREYAQFCRNRMGYLEGRICCLPESAATRFESLLFINSVCPPGLILVKREIYQRVGPWDSSLRNVQDWDMLLRLTRHGTIAFVSETILKYRRHANNGSNDVERSDAETQSLYRKTYMSGENDAQRKRMLRDAWRAWQLFRFKAKSQELRESIRARKYVTVGRLTTHLMVHIFRWLRGYPTASGF